MRWVAFSPAGWLLAQGRLDAPWGTGQRRSAHPLLAAIFLKKIGFCDQPPPAQQKPLTARLRSTYAAHLNTSPQEREGGIFPARDWRRPSLTGCAARRGCLRRHQNLRLPAGVPQLTEGAPPLVHPSCRANHRVWGRGRPRASGPSCHGP